MPRSPDLPCARCGRMMWRRKNCSLPLGQATCHPCRALIRAEKAALAPDWSMGQCEACGDTFGRTSRQRRKIYCDPCREARDQARWRDSWYRRQGVIAKGELFTAMDILREYGSNECHICGEGIDLTLEWPAQMSLSLDHVIPLSRGGLHTLTNVRPAHLTCNITKGARMDEAAA